MTKECVIKDLFECDKSCNIAEYLDHKKCRNEIIDKLLEECSENIYGNEMLYNETLDVIPSNAIPLKFETLAKSTYYYLLYFFNKHMN